MGVIDRAHPVAHGFVGGVLEGFAAAGHAHDAGAQQLHAKDIELLSADVFHHVSLRD